MFQIHKPCFIVNSLFGDHLDKKPLHPEEIMLGEHLKNSVPFSEHIKSLMTTIIANFPLQNFHQRLPMFPFIFDVALKWQSTPNKEQQPKPPDNQHTTYPVEDFQPI